MKRLSLFLSLLLTTMIVLVSVGISLADDGTIFRRNVSKAEDLATGHAAIKMLPVYVQPQAADGTVLEYISILDAEGSEVEQRTYVQPLIVHYAEGDVETIEEDGYGGFPGHGHRDAFGAVSLDGGNTWKRSNLSKSGDLSSFKIKLDGRQKVPYPGDVGRSFMASDGNQVLVVWVSRYAKGGNPNYAMSDDERLNVATYLGLDVTACTDGDLITTPCLYLEDHFSVAGSQRSSDLADEGYPLIGELPYAAVWAARGVILPPEATELEATSFVWFKAERLSSAVRDANRPEAKCVKGAGCVVSWQEDPDGIRPGSGDGPGEGWSGAIAHHQTDTWYSYIGWDEFSLVSDGDYGTFYMDGTGDLAEWVAANGTGQPQAAIPMSIPVRLTDNAMCVAEGDKPYCYADFDDSGTADFCADSVNMTIETPEGPTQDVDMCITEDGRLLRGNTASTRARLGLHGYSTTVAYSFAEVADNSEFFNTIDSAWLTMSYEENKGLGDCEEDPASEDPVDKVDMGKNVWYHTFDMFNPELVSQGLMLNQPAIYPDDFTDPNGVLDEDPNDLGFNFFIIDPDPIYETTAGLETTLYQTEIARRPSQITQNFYDAGPSGTVALQLWKQGIVRRGGPADIMGRRFVIPTDGTSTTTHTLCTTFNEVCDSEYQVCTVPDCEIFPNEDYKYTGQCKKPNPPTSCYLYYYLDENGDRVYTNDPEDPNACTEPVCGEWQAGFCPTDLDDDQTCEQVSECLDPVEGFCPSDLDPLYQYCEESTECHTVPECPADTPDYQECTTTSTGTDGFDSTAVNPYAYINMVCDTWAFTEGLNPRYVKGFCADPAINLSGNTILTSESCGDAIGCRDAFPFSDYFDDIDMTDSLPISKIYTWEMIGPGFTDDPGSFEDPLDIDGDLTNLNDTSWANPYDMAKGHRGFMTGDMIMAMYAWTPNWNDLTNAHSIVNLYVRRSFDGGLTWSTTPGSYTHTNGETYSGNGTTTCENMGPISEQVPTCVTYVAGQFEQARNVSQLLGSQVTVLDPRYSPTSRTITATSVSTLLPVGFIPPDGEDLDTVRDPSRFFMVYETGHASAYDAGEATPLDLFYSRAVDWGDHYLVWQETADTAACLPSAEDEALAGFCNEFDALEGFHDSESGEASVTASPGSQFFYSVWNQVDFDHDGYEVGSDAWYRRILFLDGYLPTEE